MNNQIHFNIKDGKVKVSFQHELDFPTFLQVIQTGILSAMNILVERANNKEKAREELFNLYNVTASNTLHYFAPDIDMRPDLTEDAILRAENEILNEHWRKKHEK